MPSRRSSRVNDQIRQEVSDLIRTSLRDPRVDEFVSITQVDVAQDLRTAKVYVSTLGDEDTRRRTLDGLEAASHFLRRELKPRLNIRSIPMLTFVRDSSIEEGMRLFELIKEANAALPQPDRTEPVRRKSGRKPH